MDQTHPVMFRMPLTVRLLPVLLAIPGAVWSAEPKQAAPAEYSAEVGIGIEYDSNITVEEVDRASNQSDYALTLDLGLGVEKGITGNTKIAASYDFNQNLYKEFSQVDRQTHILGADFSVDNETVDSDISFYYISSLLDDHKFLQLYRVSPAISGFLAKKWFARGAYVYSDKSIENRPERDAKTNAGEADLYYFYRGLRSYFNLGYRYRSEDANADSLDYLSQGVKLRYVQRFDVFSRLAKLELAWRYEDRDYRAVTPGIGQDRHDRRNRWRADVELPVYGGAALQLYYSYADYKSNYAPADYTQQLAGARFVYRW